MRFNQNGFSMIQVMVSLAILAAAAVYFTKYMDIQIKADSRRLARNSINDLAQLVKVRLKGNVCEDNLHKAFGDLALNNPVYDSFSEKYFIESDQWTQIRGKKYGFKEDANSPTYQQAFEEPLISANFEYDNGKVFVENVSYAFFCPREDQNQCEFKILEEISGSFKRQTKLTVKLELVTCSDGTAPYRMVNNVKTRLCSESGLIRSNKFVNMLVRFNLDGSHKIEKVNGQKFNPNTGKWEDSDVPSDQVPGVKCISLEGDDNEEDVECLRELKMFLVAGRVGKTSCNVEIGAEPKIQNFYASTPVISFDNFFSPGTATNQDFPVPTKLIPGTMLMTLVGGGGGGGAGRSNPDRPGGGGKAGEKLRLALSLTPGETCTAKVGAGGKGGTGLGLTEGARNGGITEFDCETGKFTAFGGYRGESELEEHQGSNCGLRGEDLYINGQLFSGGSGNCHESGGISSAGNSGAGGGGGGTGQGTPTKKRLRNGGKGGEGRILMQWSEFKLIADPDNILESNDIEEFDELFE